MAGRRGKRIRPQSPGLRRRARRVRAPHRNDAFANPRRPNSVRARGSLTISPTSPPASRRFPHPPCRRPWPQLRLATVTDMHMLHRDNLTAARIEHVATQGSQTDKTRLVEPRCRQDGRLARCALYCSHDAGTAIQCRPYVPSASLSAGAEPPFDAPSSFPGCCARRSYRRHLAQAPRHPTAWQAPTDRNSHRP